MIKKEIKKLVGDLQQRIEKDVPLYGDFETIELSMRNTDRNCSMGTFSLELAQPTKGIEDREIKRCLRLVAYNDNAGMEIMMAYGSKQEILDKIAEDLFLQKLEKAMERLDEELCHV